MGVVLHKFDHIMDNKRGNKSTSRGKQAYHHSQGYHVDEKFSLKVQKKPMHGLRHIKVEQAEGPGGIKLYSIKVKQKSPRLLRDTSRIKDSTDAQPSGKRKGGGDNLNETFRFADNNFDETLQPKGHQLQIVTKDLRNLNSTDIMHVTSPTSFNNRRLDADEDKQASQ